jgi:hypothetical protein
MTHTSTSLGARRGEPHNKARSEQQRHELQEAPDHPDFLVALIAGVSLLLLAARLAGGMLQRRTR